MDAIKNIKKAFLNLKNKNRFFVSEADFQHSFAMELEKIFNGTATILLEFPIGMSFTRVSRGLPEQ